MSTWKKKRESDRGTGQWTYAEVIQLVQLRLSPTSLLSQVSSLTQLCTFCMGTIMTHFVPLKAEQKNNNRSLTVSMTFKNS